MIEENWKGEIATPEQKIILFENIAGLAKMFHDQLHERLWMEEEQKWRWEHFNVPLRIVCAANRYKDYIVPGIRHHDEMMRLHMETVGGFAVLYEYAGNRDEQGFLDQYSNYRTRKEARIIADAAGQIKFPDRSFSKTELFSENMW